MSLGCSAFPTTGLSARAVFRACSRSSAQARFRAVLSASPPVACGFHSRAQRWWSGHPPQGKWSQPGAARCICARGQEAPGRGQWRGQGEWQHGSRRGYGSHRSLRQAALASGGGGGAAATATATMGTAAFVQLSEGEENDGDDGGLGIRDLGTDERNSTGEGRMLQASRAELEQAKSVGEDEWGLARAVHRTVLFVDVYVWEPLCTGLRFLHLAAIFIPVIAAVPALWLGGRVPERDNERSGTLWWYGFLVKSMELAGPAFIKLGQWAASRSDIFPTEMCELMSKLHSHAPAHSLEATRRIVEAAFDGRPFADIFEEFQETPLGVGAIAQVYRAKLKPDLAAPGDQEDYAGSKASSKVSRRVQTVLKSTPLRVPSSYVAVKVLHPGVERTVRRDLRIMGFVAALLNAVPTIHWLSLPDEVAQFGEMMRLQLDLRIEAANLTLFRRNFRDRTTASFPFPYIEFTTRSVLVEEFAQGIPLSDFLENGGGVFQRDISAEGLDAFLRMLLLDNFVHADLHPGNIMVRFYQAAQPDLPKMPNLPQLPHRKKREETREQPQQEKEQRQEMEQEQEGDQGQATTRNQSHPDGADVTEEVLARLRPFRHRRNKAAWEAELQRIDDEGFRPQLIFLDTGLVTELNATNRRNFLDLFRAVAEFDGYRAGELMCERCRQPDAVLDKDVFALKMQHLVLGVKSSTLALGNVRIGDVLQRVLGMVRSHHVRLEGDFVNVVISVLLLEGIGRSLNPDLDLLSASLPILREMGAQSGAQMVKSGDFSMLMVWLGLETRRFLRASIEDVERCVKYDLLSPNV